MIPPFPTIEGVGDEQFYVDPSMLALYGGQVFFNSFQQYQMEEPMLKEFIRKQM